ncbi:MAG: HU family DNA-binding protein [Dysgonomonas sp.]
MANEEIVKNIFDHLQHNNVLLSQDEVELLLASTTKAINNCLENQEEVEIEDFGNFIRRKTTNTSFTNFKPCERLLERIQYRK